MLFISDIPPKKSFDASLEAVHGLLSGEMDETQAFDTFRSVMNRKDPEKKATVNFENEYSISLNDRNGRDAASSILTTIREENDAQLALTPYYYFYFLYVQRRMHQQPGWHDDSEEFRYSIIC